MPSLEFCEEKSRRHQNLNLAHQSSRATDEARVRATLARRKVEWDLYCGTAESPDEHVGTEGEEVRNAQRLARQGGAGQVCWRDVGIKGAQILSGRPQPRRPHEERRSGRGGCGHMIRKSS